MPTPEKRFKRTKRFSFRLAGAFALTALMTAAVASIILGLVWNQQFETYRRNNLNMLASNLANSMAVMYTHTGGPTTGVWSQEALMPVADYFGNDTIAVRVADLDGNIIADSTGELTGTNPNKNNPDGSAEDDATKTDDTNGNVAEKSETPISDALQTGGLMPSDSIQVPITLANGTQIGTVNMWVYGKNTLLSAEDLAFRARSYQAMAFAGIITVIIASLAGWIFSAQLVSPINKITETARKIRGGDEDARTGLVSEDEIGELGRTFDEMANAIEQDRELERRLTSDVAHELRTPLMAIQATVEAMQDGVLPADEEHLYRVSNETVRLSRLVDAILELTRLERGSLPFDMTAVDVSCLVTETVNNHEALFEASELKLTSSITKDLTVCGDADRLRQAFGNILSNAARYTPEGGSVAVTLTSDGTNAVFEVADTGIGIEPENLNRVFSRFWRADGARNRAHGGLGIGLSVTKEIVDRHNGTITAHQRDDGVTGAAFVITVPLLRKGNGKGGNKGSNRTNGKGGNKGNNKGSNKASGKSGSFSRVSRS